MTKAELVSAIASSTGLQKAQAKHAVDAFVASVTGELKAGNEVRLVGFGSFVPAPPAWRAIPRRARRSKAPRSRAPDSRSAKAFAGR